MKNCSEICHMEPTLNRRYRHSSIKLTNTTRPEKKKNIIHVKVLDKGKTVMIIGKTAKHVMIPLMMNLDRPV